MTDTILSVRLPSTMLKEIKQLSEQNHYVDLSEYIRAILRNKCENQEIKHKEQTKEENKILDEKKQKLVEELEKLVEELKRD